MASPFVLVAKGGAAYGAGEAWQKLGLPGQAPTSISDAAEQAKKLTLAEAKKLKRDTLASMGIPDIHMEMPKKLTAEGVKDAAYAVGKVYAEKAIEAETGIPIKLPKKLTVKELENMVGSLFPSDAIEAINMALSIGVQFAASAITTVLAGTAIGSAIPGLGTIVGLAVGLAVVAVKGLFFKGPTHPEGRACQFGSPRIKSGWCPSPKANLDSFQFFTWASTEMQPLWDGLRAEQQKRACGRGGAIDCVRGLSSMRDTAFGICLATVDTMGPPALDAAFAEIDRAPDIVSRQAAGSGFGEGAVTFVSGYRGAQPISQELRPIYNAKTRLLGAIHQRRVKLQALIGQAAGIDKLAARGNVAPQLRWTLVGELQRAAVQVQNNPTAAAVQWFTVLAGYVVKLDKKQQAATKADADEAARRMAIAKAKIAARTPDAPPVLDVVSVCQQSFAAWAASDARSAYMRVEDITKVYALCEQGLTGRLTSAALTAKFEVIVAQAYARERAPTSFWEAFLVGLTRSANPFVREG